MFIELPAKPYNIKKRKLIYGVGINDAPYDVTYTDPVTKIKSMCPYYKKWASILNRCYGQNFKEKRPTYSECTVDPNWHRFSNFRAWMYSQDWEGKHLDKDLLSYHKKHYSTETCLFISSKLNNLLTLRQRYRGKHPLGVSKTTIKGYTYFVASHSFYGKQKRLGYFKTPHEAAECYKTTKLKYIKELADAEQNPRIRQALLNIK